MGISSVRFPEAWDKRVEGDFERVPARFISRSDLLVAKRAVGRAPDLINADLLSLAAELNIAADKGET